MDYACPHCQTSLKWRRVLPPERDNAIPAGSATLACPQCSGGLIRNAHPAETAGPFGLNLEVLAYVTFGLSLLLAALLQALLPPLFTLATVHLAAIGGYAWNRWQLYTVTLARFPRYLPGTLRYIAQRGFPD